MNRIRSKYLIIWADLLSDLGNQFVQLTLLDLLIFRGENALSSLLVMCVIEQAPSIFLGPFAGLWIDRMGGRRWLLLVIPSKCLLVYLLIFQSDVWVIFPAYLCLIICSLFFNIGRLSLIPMLIPKDGLISFNSLNERVSLSGRIFGPWLIGWIVLKTGQGVALGLAGLLFTFSALAVYGLPKYGQHASRAIPDPGKGQGLRPLVFTYREPFRDNPRLKAYFMIFGFVLLGGGVLNLGLPIFFKTRFGRDIADWGLILSGFQAGSCLATFLLPRCSTTFGRQTILAFTFLTMGVAMALFGQLTTYIQMVLLMILLGCGFTLMHIFLESLIQQNSTKAQMGKTMSLLLAYRGACYLGTIFCSALVIKIWGVQFLLLTGSLFMVLASFLCSDRGKVVQHRLTH